MRVGEDIWHIRSNFEAPLYREKGFPTHYFQTAVWWMETHLKGEDMKTPGRFMPQED